VYTFWLLGLACLATLVRRAVPRAPLALWGCALTLYLSTVLLIGMTRLRVPLDPFLILIAAAGAVAAWERVGPALRR
jgi:hypothetical protein